MTEFSERLADLRRERGYTQYSFAEALKTSRSNICGYEAGEKFPKYEMLVRMCQLLGVTSDYMLGLDKEKSAVSHGIFVDQLKGLREAYNGVPRERQRTVDGMLKDIYAVMEAALKCTSEEEMALYIDLFDVARRVVSATHGDE